MNSCIFSPCRKYRYTLWREFQTDFLFSGGNRMKPGYVQFIGLNPSTADERNDDPTIRRCIDFAQRWGFGAFCMTNLFAWRDTDPFKMKGVEEPVGADNDRHLLEIAKGAGLIVAAWGNHGTHRNRQTGVVKLLAGFDLKCFRVTGQRCPEHPLYQPAERQLIPFTL